MLSNWFIGYLLYYWASKWPASSSISISIPLLQNHREIKGLDVVAGCTKSVFQFSILKSDLLH